ncbi:glycosyl transferase [Candidatus Moduliflexus flocculans]|uniref:Glycosyl transferase n=1 Tax=Candidatus Moduliflexus flocculans TaxID=1499966 RepID=A0A081BMI8_9BACT|nr:glycosyl transferase [Candidatus Moduliflexus flocculans]
MISIVVINWNGKKFLRECLESLRIQTCQDVEIIAIDNASTDGSQEWLRQEPLDRLFLNAENLGYCGGANQGIAHARGEFILIINPDVILEADFLGRLSACAEQHSEVGIFSGKLLRFDRKTLDSTGQFLRKNLTPFERGYDEEDRGQYEQAGYVFSSCGAVALYRRAMLEQIRLDSGYFDADYFAFYEDLDIGWRAQLFGWKAYYLPEAVAYHFRGGGLSEQSRPLSWFERIPWIPRVSFTQKPYFIQRHIIKNRYLTMLKNASWRVLFAGLPQILRLECLILGYMLFVRPSLFRAFWEVIQLLPGTWRKRRHIQRRQAIPASEVLQYIREA